MKTLKYCLIVGALSLFLFALSFAESVRPVQFVILTEVNLGDTFTGTVELINSEDSSSDFLLILFKDK